MTLFFLGIASVLLGGLSALALRRQASLAAIAFGVLVGLGCALAVVPAIRVLAGGVVPDLRLSAAVPGGDWVFGVDPLSAFFLVIVLTVGAASALYGISYLAPEAEHRPVAASHLLMSLEIASLAMVVTARAAMPFLIAWECMAVLAYFLIVFESDHAEVRRAGLVYLIGTHTGTLALIALFAFWAQFAGNLSFDALAAASPRIPAEGALVFALGVAGFGFKAGLVPLHFWLPGAHGAAPSHVSALMSGVVIKMGIYGLLRLVILVGAPPAWWGWLVLSLGLISGVLGVLWALAQHDLKRLLAYHSVENIGIILLGLGIGALGLRYHAPVVAVLGFAGAVLHTLNHALFKSLLFLGAGAVLRATGTRLMDRLGGLARRMPFTWTAFLIGSVAIVGLPPLNGFVSEWVVYQALLGSAQVPAARAAILAVPGLALIGALALACFAKVGGAVFLGRPRSPAAEAGGEVPRSMLGPMFALALACAAIGVAPMIAVVPAIRVGASIGGLGGGPMRAAAAAVGPSLLGISLLAVLLVVLAGAGWWLRELVLRRRPRAWSDTWACGYAFATPRMQYTAASFAAPLLHAYAPAAGVQVERTAGAFHTHPKDLVLDRLVLPLWERLRRGAFRARPIQHGRLGSYLLYLLGALLLLLLYLAVRVEGVGP
jgi:hydrogenase-4 component B